MALMGSINKGGIEHIILDLSYFPFLTMVSEYYLSNKGSRVAGVKEICSLKSFEVFSLL